MPSGGKKDQRGNVAGEIEQLGTRSRATQVVAQQQDKGGGKEGAGSWAKEAIVEARADADQKTKQAVTNAVVCVFVANAWRKEKVDGKGDQQYRNQIIQPVGYQILNRQRAKRRPHKGPEYGTLQLPRVEFSLAEEIIRSRRGAKGTLQLVGGKGLQGGNTRPQQCGKGN